MWPYQLHSVLENWEAKLSYNNILHAGLKIFAKSCESGLTCYGLIKLEMKEKLKNKK